MVGIDYANLRLIRRVVVENFGEEALKSYRFTLRDLFYILTELQHPNVEKYLVEDNIQEYKRSRYSDFRSFVKYLLYRNLANYDSMVLLTADKGFGKSSVALMTAKEWCKLIGIKFDPKRHIAYTNADMMHRLNVLNKFEPLIADEAVRFACVSGDTKIMTNLGERKIKDLYNRKSKVMVLSYNTKTERTEFKEYEKIIKTGIKLVYELKLYEGTKIKATGEHKFLTQNGWKQLKELTFRDKIYVREGVSDRVIVLHVRSIKLIGEQEVYDIINVKDNKNYVANDMIVHNSSADWAKRESKLLRQKLAEVRTKHLLFILAFPLKIYKMEKTYLESFVNYWISLFGRGIGAVYVKDQNPVLDSWRMKEFQNIGSYTEFSDLKDIENRLKRHPNFWKILRFPKPSAKLYNKYLEVRESNVYSMSEASSLYDVEDVRRALIILTMNDILTNDPTLSVSRVLAHIRNTYDISISKNSFNEIVEKAKTLIQEIRNRK